MQLIHHFLSGCPTRWDCTCSCSEWKRRFAVAPETLVGFTDMFIPALLITGITSVKTVPDIYGTNADRDSVDRILCEPGAVKSGKQRKCGNYLDKAPQIG